MLRKSSAITITALSLTLAACGSPEPAPASIDMGEIVDRTSLHRASLQESLSEFQTDGCHWGYSTINSSNLSCFQSMELIMRDAKGVASAMDLMTKLELPGHDSALVADTARVSASLGQLEGIADERDLFASNNTEALEVLRTWPDSDGSGD